MPRDDKIPANSPRSSSVRQLPRSRAPETSTPSGCRRASCASSLSMNKERRVKPNHDRRYALFCYRSKCVLDFLRAARFHWHNDETDFFGGRLGALYHSCGVGVVRVCQNGHAGQPRAITVVSNSSCFGAESVRGPCQSSRIAARTRETGDEAIADRVCRVSHNDGNRRRRLLRRTHRPLLIPFTMTSTFSRASSAARSARRSYWPSAERHSTTKSLPSK